MLAGQRQIGCHQNADARGGILWSNCELHRKLSDSCTWRCCTDTPAQTGVAQEGWLGRRHDVRLLGDGWVRSERRFTGQCWWCFRPECSGVRKCIVAVGCLELAPDANRPASGPWIWRRLALGSMDLADGRCCQSFWAGVQHTARPQACAPDRSDRQPDPSTSG